MRHSTSRIRAAIGAAMIVAFASPALAQRPAPVARVRAEAQWIDGARWHQMGVRRAAARAWRHGYIRGFQRARAGFGSRAWHGYARPVPRARFHTRVRVAPWGARMMWRRSI